VTRRPGWERITFVPSDAQILAALRRGDEHAFVTLVERHQGLMLRVALRYVRTRAVA
jgi:DNA-binding GntR family transcriptional regulator